jgi:hypothetical protein
MYTYIYIYIVFVYIHATVGAKIATAVFAETLILNTRRGSHPKADVIHSGARGRSVSTCYLLPFCNESPPPLQVQFP